jgi:NADH-quinone oxidoreductase subunit N
MEAGLLLPVALLGQHFLIASHDTIDFYAGLELPNFAGVVLCSLHTRSGFGIEAALLYLVQSAFASGFMLLGTAFLFIQVGHCDWASLLLVDLFHGGFGLWLFTLGLVWKLGAVPVHHGLVAVYHGSWSGGALFIGDLMPVHGVPGCIGSVMPFWQVVCWL